MNLGNVCRSHEKTTRKADLLAKIRRFSDSCHLRVRRGDRSIPRFDLARDSYEAAGGRFRTRKVGSGFEKGARGRTVHGPGKLACDRRPPSARGGVAPNDPGHTHVRRAVVTIRAARPMSRPSHGGRCASTPFRSQVKDAMSNARFLVPPAVNEPIKDYAPGSPERHELEQSLKRIAGEKIDIPIIIGGREIRSGKTAEARVPHRHEHVLATWHVGGAEHVDLAADACRDAAQEWAAMHWTDRAAIFLRAAELLAGPWRQIINGATMLNQSKNAFQAEIDAACELIDFFRFNAHFMPSEIYEEQPLSSPGCWNRRGAATARGLRLRGHAVQLHQHRRQPADGSPALMGNTVRSGSPPPRARALGLLHHEAAGRGRAAAGRHQLRARLGADRRRPGARARPSTSPASTSPVRPPVFQQHVEDRRREHRQNTATYPRIVGETGGKDFVFAHASAADVDSLVALVRGAFEYQGQKCSAASRAYIPASLWPAVQEQTARDGPPKLRWAIRRGLLELRQWARSSTRTPSGLDQASYIDHAKSVRVRRRSWWAASANTIRSGVLHPADGHPD